MLITLNGSATDVADGTVLADLMPECRGSAAALNGTVVPRARLATALRAGDVVEIVTAVQGG
jgi:thiamine biosynthesis protein ThiS